MKPIHRFGIEIDVCPTSGGIWLDKGELEKLLSFIKQAAEEEQASYAPKHPTPEYPRSDQTKRGHAVYQDHDDDDDRYGPRRSFKKKKSGLSQIMDVFDF